jgi:triacylglycerol lipase
MLTSRTDTSNTKSGLPPPLCSPQCEPLFQPVSRPIWRESLWMFEWARLRLSPVYYGRVPARGDGTPVIVVPGFLGTDVYLSELHLWLARIGYEPVLSDIGRNADCPDVLLERLTETLDATYERADRRVVLVGHSFGGVLARAAAERRPQQVAKLVALGAPLRELRAHPLVLRAAQRLKYVLPPPHVRPRPHGDHEHGHACACTFLKDPRAPRPSDVDLVSIYSETDGVIDPKTCLVDAPGRNVRVRSSHTGLVVNAEVYEVLARELAARHAVAREAA